VLTPYAHKIPVKVYYNAGISDALSALREWEKYDSEGKFLKEYGDLIALENDPMDDNYMSYLYATYQLTDETHAGYKFYFKSL
jgi:hypothetical protein